jgi:hypothetical protein
MQPRPFKTNSSFATWVASRRLQPLCDSSSAIGSTLIVRVVDAWAVRTGDINTTSNTNARSSRARIDVIWQLFFVFIGFLQVASSEMQVQDSELRV